MLVHASQAKSLQLPPYHFILILLLILYTVEVDYVSNFNI